MPIGPRHTYLCDYLAHQSYIIRHLEYERVYLPLGKVADTPFHIQGDYVSTMPFGPGAQTSALRSIYIAQQHFRKINHFL